MAHGYEKFFPAVGDERYPMEQDEEKEKPPLSGRF